ncbi:DUF4381 domain-containing protein [Psychromonas sp. PT13]|uniref:DUF4381 domain-containing protein n=1 Tax=Psychromonas sp. PT13 TaxID=3439547 RepID=UPI003EC0BF6E
MSPLDSQNPLAQLNDIIAPNAASFWPLAPIYWALLFTLVAALIGLTYLIKRIKKQRKKQQSILIKLQELESSKANFITLNQLIKGVALQHFPRQQVASLHSEAWFDFLQRYATTPIFKDKDTFLTRLYQEKNPVCSDSDFAQTKQWIKQLPKQIKKHHQEANKHV